MRVFTSICQLAALLSPLMLLLLLLVPRLSRRYAPVARGLLWLVLAIRLLIPVGFTGERLITIPLPQEVSAAAGLLGRDMDPAGQVPVPAAPYAGKTDAAPGPALPNPPQVRPVDWQSVAFVVWAAGGMLFLGYHLCSYARTCRRLRRWSLPVTGPEAILAFDRAKERCGVHCGIELRYTGTEGPLLQGFFSPRVILSKQNLREEALEDILCHELEHYRRGDLWYKLLMLLCCSVYWFHPLVHWMSRQADTDLEAACDARVMRGMDADGRNRYGLAVLSQMGGHPVKAALTTGFGGGRKRLLRRFAEINAPAAGKRAVLILLCAVILCGGVLVGCEAAPVQAEEPDTPPAPMIQLSEPESSPSPEPAGYVEEAIRYEDLERLFREDLERNQAMAAGAQQELEDVYGLALGEESPYIGGESMVWPLPGYARVVGEYGWRYEGSDFHTGIDLTGPGQEGEPVYGADIAAATSGMVMHVQDQWTPGKGYGQYLILDHGGGVTTLYAHCSEILITKGQTVLAGQIIARVGSTGFSPGPHLHFEVRLDGAAQNPRPYLFGTVESQTQKQEGAPDEPGLVEAGEETDEGWLWPTQGGTINYGLDSYLGHTGVSIVVPAGTAIYASRAGKVVHATNGTTGYGRYLILEHGDGYITYYAHCSKLLVEEGETVTQGQVIAEVGRTGNATDNYLHFEIRKDGRIEDPEQYIGANLI